MKNKCIIQNVKITNFRGLKEFDSKNSFGNNITIFDGENGFGKTTIFDAIEFCLTGIVKRLTDSNEYKPETILKHEDLTEKESIVTLEIYNKDLEENFNISRIISEKQKGDFGTKKEIEEYILIEGKEKLEELKINENNFKDIFYIPQNDSVGLVAKSTPGMKSFMDILLNTDNESDFRKKNLLNSPNIIQNIEKINDKLNNNIKLNKEKFKINDIKFQENISNIKTNINKIKEIGNSEKIEKIDFIEIEKLKNYNSFYPKKLTNFNNSDLDKKGEYSYINKWIKLKDLSENQVGLHNSFTNIQIGKYIDDLKNNKLLIKENINYYLYYLENKEILDKNEQDLINQKNDFNTYKTNFKLLENGNTEFETVINLFPNLDNYNELDIYQELEEKNKKFLEIKREIKNKGETEKKYNEIFGTLISFWEKTYLKEKENKSDLIIKEEGNKKIIDDICPLCTSEINIDKIKDQIKSLSLKSGNSEGKKSSYSFLYLKTFLERLENILEELEKEIEISKKVKDNIKIFKKTVGGFIKVNEYESFKIDKFNELDKIKFSEIINEDTKNKNLEFLDNIILELEKLEKEPELDDGEKYGELIENFKSLFNENDYNKNSSNILKDINIEDIENNINFFENEFKKLQNKEKENLVAEIKKKGIESKKIFSNNKEIKKINNFYNKRLSLLTLVEGKINNYGAILKIQIDKYKEEKIEEISIPVYLFSQRIVKSYAGIGVYLAKDGIKLINNNSKAEYTLSSGQIEATMISVLLANNINQNFSLLNTILIDDPIQSLDDLNILSFINLLRYQFSDKQIIISTHDDGFSRFIRYKFWRLHGNDSQKNINMKDEFFSEK